jgi:PAS domain S-box-containing protein
MIEDITERRRAEDALRFTQFAVDKTIDQAFWMTEDAHFFYVNEAACHTLGYSREELLKMSVPDIGPTFPPEVFAQHWRDLQENESAMFESFHRTKDGHIYPVEIRANYVVFDGKEYNCAFATDITQRKRIQEEKENLQAQLQQAQKMESVARLAGGVAHDFNNMLGVILGHVELAMEKVNPEESINDNLKEIKEAVQRSADLTRQLLAYARRQTIAPKILDLNECVTAMLKMLQRLIGEDIDLVWVPGADLWPIKIDAAQIDQLLANLCVNARDAIAGVGKVTIETVNVTFDKAYCDVHQGFNCGEYVMFAVSDDGSGMSKDVMNHLFEPFFTTKELGKGTGLGLATVYGIVKQNDGFINVYSEPGEGTTFKIYLPRFAGEAMEPAAESNADTQRGRGETVLLVEDEAMNLEVSRAILEKLGYSVLIASKPAEALEQARKHCAELKLLITDVIMPEMNGWDLAKLINEIKPGLNCLFTSGYTANVITHRGVLDEGLHFLQKPFSINDLASKVREALE